MIDSRTGEIVEVNEHTSFYHWRLGSMHLDKPTTIDKNNTLQKYIILNIDDNSSIVKIMNENMNEFLVKEPKTYSVYSLGIWLFLTIEDMGENVFTRHWKGLLTGRVKKCWDAYIEMVNNKNLSPNYYIEQFISKCVGGAGYIKSQMDQFINDVEIKELSQINYFKDNLANFTNDLEFVNEFPYANEDNLIFYAKSLEILNKYRIEALKQHFHKDDDGLFNITLLNKTFDISDEHFKKSKQTITNKCENIAEKMERDYNLRTKAVTDKLLSRMKDRNR